jgi:hypothetical protein
MERIENVIAVTVKMSPASDGVSAHFPAECGYKALFENTMAGNNSA